MPIAAQGRVESVRQPQTLQASQHLLRVQRQELLRFVSQTQTHGVTRRQGQERIAQQRHGHLRQGPRRLPVVGTQRRGEQQLVWIVPEGLGQDLLEQPTNPWCSRKELLELVLAIEPTHQRRLEPVEQQAGTLRARDTLEEFFSEALQGGATGVG